MARIVVSCLFYPHLPTSPSPYLPISCLLSPVSLPPHLLSPVSESPVSSPKGRFLISPEQSSIAGKMLS
ncbi:hypothetical protein RVR34_23270 [Microcystis aeruginosa FBCC-A68]|uniref:hypothetical protein n=1 Tax=Microcystis aeruginosa TaxID=1126 RepID=UPI001483368C|nr:hypothetical protein [Microcystis aeruginosa]